MPNKNNPSIYMAYKSKKNVWRRMRDFKINTDLKENFMQFSRESLGFFMEFNYEGQILA